MHGTWVGGLASPSGNQPCVWLDFDAGRGWTVSPDAAAPLRHVEAGDDFLRFEVVLDATLHVFELRKVSASIIEGPVGQGDVGGMARFDRLASFDATAFAREVGGTYASTSGAFLVSVEAANGRLFDIESGATHALFPLTDGTYLVGPGLATAFPGAGSLRLIRDNDGRVTELTLDVGDRHAAARRHDPVKHDVRFSSAGVELAATVLRAEGAAPRPGVVFVHGSGRIARDEWWQQAMARVFLRAGVDVLLYDKRGVGDSGGEYVGRGAKDANNVSPENLERLAADANAAVAALAAEPGVDAARVGLFGISQAGWIIPLAASTSKQVAFVAEVSGPTVSTFLEDVHSKLLAEDDSGPSHLTMDEAEVVVGWAPADRGFDPAPALSRLRVPALFIYGALDASIPTRASVKVLERLRGGHDFEVVTLANGNHELFAVARDTRREQAASAGLAEGALPALRAWLAAHVQKPR